MKPKKPVDPAKAEQRNKNREKKIARAKRDKEQHKEDPDHVKQRGLISSSCDRPDRHKRKSQ